MDRIEQTYIIAGTPEEVWEALTNPELIPQWSGAPATYTPEPEAEYSLWGGDIGGRVVQVEPGQRLVQTWQPTSWQRDDSVVTFLLTPTDEGTRVDLVHDNVEESDYAGTTEGWDIYYLGPIKKMIEGRAPQQPTPKKRAPAKKKTSVKTRKASAKKTATSKKSTSKRALKKTAKKKSAAKKRA